MMSESETTTATIVAKVVDEDTTVNAMYADQEIVKAEDGNAEKLTLHVIDLSYTPPKEFLKNAFESFRNKLNELKIGWLFPSLREVQRSAYRHVPLKSINFSASVGEVTCLLGATNERHQVISLLSGRTITGKFSGDIFLSGAGIKGNDYYYDKMAYVQRVSGSASICRYLFIFIYLFIFM